ncbi:MAG: ferric reductase-like transmembrane domain-containing protein [Candidatus Dormibacteraeota bacterium]|nr:ferric reductase-like transmembrane domain-containing protein [Candidatus Dormibacteraeota bacterium]
MTGSHLLWFTTRGAGALSLVLLSLVVALGLLGAVSGRNPRWPRFLVTTLHRNLALLGLVFLAIHVVTAVLDPFTALGWGAALVPWGSSYRPLWVAIGVLSLYLGAAVIVTSLLRRWLSYRAWRFVHWSAYALWPLALIHSLGAGSDTRFMWMDTVYTACCAVVAVFFVIRLARRKANAPEPLPEYPGGPPRWSQLDAGLRRR